MAKPNNIIELRESLLDMYDMAVKDPKRMNQAKEVFNGAGKTIGTLKLEIEYALARGEQPDVPFLGKTSGILLKDSAKKLLSA